MIKVKTKRMSTTASVIRVWWNVDFISGLKIIKSSVCQSSIINQSIISGPIINQSIMIIISVIRVGRNVDFISDLEIDCQDFYAA